MNIFYFNINKLKHFLFKQKFVENIPLHKRFEITNHLVEQYFRKHNLNNKGPKELEIAFKLFLFQYYINNVTSLSAIVENYDLKKKNIIVIRKGVKKLYALDEVKEILLPNKYSVTGVLFKLITGILAGIINKDEKSTEKDILVLSAGNGKLENEIWQEISIFLAHSYQIKNLKYNKIQLKPRFNFQKQKLKIQFEKDLKLYKKVMPYFLINLFRLQFHNLHQFLLRNPSKIVVSFEQSSPYTALLAYIAKNMGRTFVNIAHAPTFGENYKHNPADYNLVYGESSKTSFSRKDSVICGEIIEVGAPKTDYLFRKEKEGKKWSNDVLFLPNYVNRRRDFEQIETLKVIQKFLVAFPEIKMTVKPHPAKENPYLDKLLGHYRNVCVKVDAVLAEEIDKHDVIIMVGWSASGLEVIVREKPMIRLNIFDVADWFGYSRFGYAFDAGSFEELCDSFVYIRNNPDVDLRAKRRILKYHLTNHGRAGSETAAFFDKVMCEAG
jgi:hypothetical protein